MIIKAFMAFILLLILVMGVPHLFRMAKRAGLNIKRLLYVSISAIITFVVLTLVVILF